MPTSSQTTILINGIQYRGCVEIYTVNGELNVINEVDVENYLKSTLTLQFPKEKDAEVLDALAIVARTQAYYYIARNPGVFWHVEANKAGYEGYGIVLQNPHIDRAVESTRHMVMTYKDAPFAATWTKNSAENRHLRFHLQEGCADPLRSGRAPRVARQRGLPPGPTLCPRGSSPIL